MHELAVTESIISIAERHAQQAHAKRILRISLVIGELSSIVDDSVQFYFDHLAANTLAEGAQLVFDRRPLSLRCEACGQTWQPPAGDWTCPRCGQTRTRVEAGREFYVESIEVE